MKSIFVKDDEYVRNSHELFSKLNGFVLPDGYVLASLDVVSLFPNTPTDLTLQIIQKHWHRIDDPLIDLDTFKICFTFLVE
ncbi:hypothetical protein HHI36_022382, partial [Cryptolaemus montrouzieri]